MSRALVIGAGPAGLMAAEEMARAGLAVTLAEAMPSPARKFLMAGKSGLNLTKAEPLDDALPHYAPLPPALEAALRGFGPEAVQDWARGLGQEVFTGTTGRVFPVAMKASPLLRAWLARLAALGVTLRSRWRWTGWDGAAMRFDTPEGPRVETPDVAVLALGGASWRRLGSDGAWAGLLPAASVAPFKPANVGVAVHWSAPMRPHFGAPVKGARLIAGAAGDRGEFTVSAGGLEGGGIYMVSRALRDGAALAIDLFPDLSEPELRRRLARPRGKASLANHLRKALGLAGVRAALVNEFGRPLPGDLAPVLKALPIRHAGLRPIDEAISTAGGLRFAALDGFMLRDRPGVFACGEMLDWEAPTGGYLITGCLATGRAAGRQAVVWLRGPAPEPG
ncbi:MAG: putative oxidoreductase with FAD/NAD(P)-binding domain YhiN [Rhodobacteraceae bacterium HLUCCA08]|nr:MAG: putative oxidoreductase with FAD/NAD(P)-binding domain YhiN [Rhodobacteraceae bacterium HLUCCA08]